jgi:hypothetical protein
MKTKKKEKEWNLAITPFTSEIMGSDDEFIYLKEYNYIEGEEEFPLILAVKREHFLEMINLWLDRKTEYCKLWKEWCGVFGEFYINVTKEIGKVTLLIDVENETPIYKEVPLIEVVDFEKHCDMEHG